MPRPFLLSSYLPSSYLGSCVLMTSFQPVWPRTSASPSTPPLHRHGYLRSIFNMSKTNLDSTASQSCSVNGIPAPHGPDVPATQLCLPRSLSLTLYTYFQKVMPMHTSHCSWGPKALQKANLRACLGPAHLPYLAHNGAVHWL